MSKEIVIHGYIYVDDDTSENEVKELLLDFIEEQDWQESLEVEES